MALDVQSPQQIGSPPAAWSQGKNVRLVARWCQLRKMHERADRVLLTLHNGAHRARRLYAYVLRECGAPLDPDDAQRVEVDVLGRASRGALRALIRPLKMLLLRRTLLLCAGALLICGALFLLALAVPSGRAWLFPRDLGRTAHWQVTSALGGNGKSGVGTSSDDPLFFHTASENNPSIDLDFGKVVHVRRVVIENRADCCGERALPLNVEIPGADGPRLLCQRRAPFRSWTCDTGGVRTKTLRIRRPGVSMLHLRRIEVYE